MYKIGDYIIYKKDVCIINEIKDNYYNGISYYKISPITDNSLTINIPIDNACIKNILSKDEANKIITEIPKVELLNIEEKNLESEYKELLNTDNLLDLVKIIKTTYIRNQNRINNGEKIGDKDNEYFNKAENYLYNILSISLNIPYEECKKMITNKCNEVDL